MGKTTPTEAEQRLADLVRDANAATKDLTRAIEGAKREILDIRLEEVLNAVRQLVDDAVEAALQRFNDDITVAIRDAVGNVYDEFDALGAALIGMDIREALTKAMNNPNFMEEHKITLKLGADTLKFAKALRDRAQRSRIPVESNLFVGWEGHRRGLIAYEEKGPAR